MTRRVPFNAKQFLDRKLPLSAFHFDMLSDEIRRTFSESYFSQDDSPFTLLDKNMDIRTYLIRLPKFIRGVFDGICFNWLSNEDIEGFRFLPNMDPVEYKKFRDLVDTAIDQMNPKILLAKLDYDRNAINEAIANEYGFDFLKAAAEVETLTEALKTAQIGEIKGFKRFFIKRGPETLRNVDNIHKAIEGYHRDRGFDFSTHHSEISDAIKYQNSIVIEDLEERIFKAAPANVRSGVAA